MTKKLHKSLNFFSFSISILNNNLNIFCFNNFIYFNIIISN